MAKRPGDLGTPGEPTPPQQISTPGLPQRISNVTVEGRGSSTAFKLGPTPENVVVPDGPVANPGGAPRFSSAEGVQRWLAGKPQEWTTAMAVRAALRCIPALAGNDESDVLSTLRVASGAWLAVTKDDLASRFWPGVVVLPARDTVRPAVIQLFSSVDDPDAVWTIIQSVEVAVQIARADSAAIDVWRVVEGDARALERGRFASEVARDPLWPGNFPTWLVGAWTDLKHQLLLLNADWEVWTTWYEARLNGGAEINAIDIERVMIADEIWQQGPRAVNAEIARLIGEHRRREPGTLPTPEIDVDTDDARAGWQLSVINGPILPMSDWADAIGVFERGSPADRDQTRRLSAALEASDADSRIASYLTVFVTAEGALRKQVISRRLAERHPEFKERLTAEQNRLAILIQAEPRPAGDQAEAESLKANQLPVPTVPAQRPAAMEPVWQKGRLTLPTKPAKADLSKKKFASALTALRNEMLEFSQAIAGEANIDRRFVSFVQRLSDRIPDKPPPQDELFRLGHVEEVLAGYAKTVNDERSDFLAARYHALVLQFDRTMRQAPSWREFKRDAAQQTLTTEQIAAAPTLAAEVANALRDQDFADPAVPDSLEQLADAVHAAESGQVRNEPDVIEAGMELLAADLIDSVNNVLKRLAEFGLPLVAAAGQRAGSIASKTGKALVDGFEDGVVAAAKRVGKTCGYGLVAGFFGHGFIKFLIAQYPDAFRVVAACVAILRADSNALTRWRFFRGFVPQSPVAHCAVRRIS